MTTAEKNIARALSPASVSYLPGSVEKKFAKGLQDRMDAPISQKGRDFMLKLLHKYRKQIPGWQQLKEELTKSL